jgi:hypothetical protein
VSLVFLVALTAFAFTAFLYRAGGVYEYPFLAATVYLGWVIPQLVGLQWDNTVPAHAVDKTTIYASMCFAALWLAYHLTRRPAQFWIWSLSRKRLEASCLIMCAVGSVFYFLMSSVEDSAGSQWTGAITIYFFFSQFLSLSLILGVNLVLERMTPTPMFTALVGASLLIYRAVMFGRRAVLVELLLCVGMSLWYRRRYQFSKLAILATLVLGAFFVQSTGDYRMAVADSGLKGAESIDLLGNFEKVLNGAGSEMRNAVYYIEAVDRNGEFLHIFALWNGLVHRYVPGQLLGTGTKQALMYEDYTPISAAAMQEFQYEGEFGATDTGFASSFHSLWYFGFLWFALLAYMMKRAHLAAMRGHLVWQVFTIFVMTHALHSITHSFQWGFLIIPQFVCFILPFFAFSAIRRRHLRLAA